MYERIRAVTSLPLIEKKTLDVSVEFILRNAGADGIVSTKPNLVKEAQKQGFIAIQRTFLVDSIALNSLEKQVELSMPSAIEIMPGIMPDIIRQVKHAVNIPVISGGLLSEKKHVITALSAGADAVSTTNHALWYA
jgi:glycerol uptake operon antiterminator|nr:glycerol-3-phosphate responsive antiterminator [uncultured Schaedlerella sp.]